jgi:hypothetical protein
MSIFNNLANLNLSNTLASTSTLATSISSNITTGNYNNTTINELYGSCINPNYFYGVENKESLNFLECLNYSVIFEFDNDSKLSDSLCEINDKTFIFNCELSGNRIQPYEKLMELIEDEIKMSVKIKISNVMTICYTKFQFTNIENNFKFKNGYCNLSKLNVNFKFEKILYENNKLSVKEKRSDKLKNILKNDE